MATGCSVAHKSSTLVRGSGRVNFSSIKLSGETEDEFGPDLDFHRFSVYDLSGFEGGAELLQGQGQRQYYWLLRRGAVDA